MSGLIVEPEIVAEQRKQKERQHQLERRGIARDLLPALMNASYDVMKDPHVNNALALADELLAKTKVDP